MNQTIKSIQIESGSHLKVAKTLKKMATRLFKHEVEITFEDGDLVLHEQSNVKGLISYNQQIVVIANSEANLLAVGTQALLRLFTDELKKGATSVIFQQDQRILMIDIGRKYFPKEIIMTFIESASLAQFNFLQLHFSENEGFRIESEVAPEIMSTHFLTKNEIRELILYADSFGIEIIPDFDTPGHLKKILQDKPEWQLRKKKENGEIVRYPSALNIVNSDAVDFVERLYKEYADLFSSSRYFHIGADEFVDFDEIDAYPDLTEAAVALYGKDATAMDYFTHYVNEIAQKISSWGFIPRVWNDGFFRLNRKEIVTLSKKVEITYWTKWHKQMAPVEVFSKKGYQVINFNDNYFYYVLGEAASYTYPTFEKIINNWEPTMYAQSQKIKQVTNQFPGVALSIWCDIPEAQDEQTVWERVAPLLFAISQKEDSSYMDEEKTRDVLNTYFNRK